MNSLISIIVVPFVLGLVLFILPKGKKLSSFMAVLTTIIVFVLSIVLFKHKPSSLNYGDSCYLVVDNLSAFIILFISFFGLLIVLYSLSSTSIGDNRNKHFAFILWTIAASVGAVLSNHLIVFLTFWGILGMTLYFLISMGREGAVDSARKAFIIIGASDALILLGIAIIWKISPSLEINSMHLALTNPLMIFAFICFTLGAFAKAGAMPLHTWITDSANTAPIPVLALLPASLDKLLGIYFLYRITTDIFVLQPNSGLSLFIIIIGSITIIAAVMMALVQHNIRRLLSYHAVSQVGYMLVGIGTANPIGIAGGLFHMLNNSIYKSSLFLCGGNVEEKAGTDDLDKLGGLALLMPYTFFAFLIASFAISGIPPFNGFASKWMIYQGIVELGRTGSKLWPIWLCVAMFGSALTLASFMKLIHAVFLGQPSKKMETLKKEKFSTMAFSVSILSFLCILFGVFAYQIPIKQFIEPSMNQELTFLGFWNSSLATIFIIVGILIGALIFLLSNLKVRQTRQFIGGEKLAEDMRPSGVDFYSSVSDIGVLGRTYNLAERKFFDIYEIIKKIALKINSFLEYLHNGVLPTYLVWVLLGMITLLVIIL